MRVTQNAQMLLNILGKHLTKSIALTLASENSDEVKLKTLTHHLGALGKGLEEGDYSVLGIEAQVDKPRTRKKKAATASTDDLPSFMFGSIPQDTDPTRPVVIFSKDHGILALAVTQAGLVRALHRVVLAAPGAGITVSVEDFKAVEGFEANFQEGDDASVFSPQAFLATYGAGMTTSARNAYKGLGFTAIPGFNYDEPPTMSRVQAVTGKAAKERAAHRAKLDAGRPYTQEALAEMGKGDLLTIASLCGIDDAVGKGNEELIAAILAAEVEENPTLAEIASAIKVMPKDEIASLLKDEGVEVEDSEDIDEFRTRATEALQAKYAPSPADATVNF